MGEPPSDVRLQRRCGLSGVRDRVCYFEVYFTDDMDGPGVSILGNNKAHISSECGLLFVSKED